MVRSNYSRRQILVGITIGLSALVAACARPLAEVTPRAVLEPLAPTVSPGPTSVVTPLSPTTAGVTPSPVLPAAMASPIPTSSAILAPATDVLASPTVAPATYTAAAAPTAAASSAPAIAAAPISPPAVPTVAPTSPPIALLATPTAAPAPGTAIPVPTSANGAPRFSDVSQRTPADVLLYLQGKLTDYPGSGPASSLNFSPSDILETMDTIVLDHVQQNRGDAALQQIYSVIARTILATLQDVYPNQRILVALDAGHGGKVGYYWDPGSEGTEATHTRAVIAALKGLVQTPDFGRFILRPIYNDSIADDFGLPANYNRKTVNQILMRQSRASMLALEASAWNRAHADAPVAVHEISVHFNAGAGGAMVLHEGDSVRPEFAARSIDYGQRYLQRVLASLNATGVLPTPLGLWGGNGLHDDAMMYRPTYISPPTFPGNTTLRYGSLQGSGYLPHYIQLLLNPPAG